MYIHTNIKGMHYYVDCKYCTYKCDKFNVIVRTSAMQTVGVLMYVKYNMYFKNRF